MSISSSDSAAPEQLSHYDFQPIAKLPSDLLEQIFLILNKPQHFGEPDFISVRASLRISWVCSRWRAIALSCRKIWARCVSWESRSRMQDEFIRRSDPWPLDLYGGTIRAERLPIFANPNIAQRVRSLMIHFESACLDFIPLFFNQSLPRLETIHLSMHGQVQTNFAISKDTLARSRAGNVKEIRCRYGVNFDLKSFLDEPTLIHRLITLELDHIPLEYMIYCNDLLQFLSEARNLESLSLRTKIMFEPPSVKRQRGEIKLSKLTSVSLELSSPVALAILPFVFFSDNLSTFELRISLEDLGQYPVIISSLEHLIRHWDREWNPSVDIGLTAHAAFFIEAIDTPILGKTSTVSRFSLQVYTPTPAQEEERRLAMMKATTHLAYPAIQALERTILSTAHRVSIQKPIEVPVSLDTVISSTMNLAMNGSWNLLDGLLNSETLSNMTELSLSLDVHPFIRHILNHVVDSVQKSARQGGAEYSFLPKLRVITFSLDGVDYLPLCSDLVGAGFFVEKASHWELKVTLPGRYKGEPPVQKAVEELLRIP